MNRNFIKIRVLLPSQRDVNLVETLRDGKEGKTLTLYQGGCMILSVQNVVDTQKFLSDSTIEKWFIAQIVINQKA